MKIEKRTVTPEIAQEYLKKNNGNLPIIKTNLHFLVDQIKRNKWKCNGEPIIIASSGRVLDGQHRLKACILAGKAIQVFVGTGFDEEVFHTIDTGRVRQAKDILKHNGVMDYVAIGAICRFIITYKKGNKSAALSSGDKGIKISNDEIIAFFERNKKRVIEALDTGRYVSSYLNRMTRSFTGGIYYILSEIDEKKADSFFSKLASGEDLSGEHPILILRNKIISSTEVHKSYMKLNIDFLALIFIAWNKYRKNQKVDRLYWNKKDEEFPKPI